MKQLSTPLVAKTPEETSRLFEDAVNANDLDALLTLYEPEASSATSLTTSVHGIDAIRESLKGLLGMGGTMRLSPLQVIDAHDLAEVVGDWTMAGTDPAGKPISLTGRYVDVVRKQADGRWLFVIDNGFLA